LVISAPFDRNWIKIQTLSRSFSIGSFVAVNFDSASFWQDGLRFIRKQYNRCDNRFVANQQGLLFQPGSGLTGWDDLKHEFDYRFCIRYDARVTIHRFGFKRGQALVPSEGFNSGWIFDREVLRAPSHIDSPVRRCLDITRLCNLYL